MGLYSGETYFIAEFLIQRSLALVYLFAFLVIYRQYVPLVGEEGLSPIKKFIEDKKFSEVLSIFYFENRDVFLKFSALVGVTVSLITFFGISSFFSPEVSVVLWLLLWILFVSFRNTGQIFWKQGAILVETGFLAIFLGTLETAPSEIIIWLLRWTLFRMMFNSGLAKLKSDSCWRKFTCLKYQFETQPFPGPLSWWLHHLPDSVKKLGGFFTLFAMLVVPWFYFAPQPLASIAGIITVVYQLNIGVSGNYSWLNLVAVSLSFSTFSDEVLNLLNLSSTVIQPSQPYPFPDYATFFAVVIFSLSIVPTLDMFLTDSKEVIYGRLPLVNIYAKFCKVERTRHEIVIEGKAREEANWKEYRTQYSPPEKDKRPPQIAPYYYRLDYTLYQSRRRDNLDEEWISNLMVKLLENDGRVLNLLKKNPFENREPPERVRLVKYRYSYTTREERTNSGNYWKRERINTIRSMSQDSI